MGWPQLELVEKPHILLQAHDFGCGAQRLKLAISTDMSRFPPGEKRLTIVSPREILRFRYERGFPAKL